MEIFWNGSVGLVDLYVQSIPQESTSTGTVSIAGKSRLTVTSINLLPVKLIGTYAGNLTGTNSSYTWTPTPNFADNWDLNALSTPETPAHGPELPYRIPIKIVPVKTTISSSVSLLSTRQVRSC